MKPISIVTWILRTVLALLTLGSLAVSFHGIWAGEWWSAFGLVIFATLVICNVAAYFSVSNESVEFKDQVSPDTAERPGSVNKFDAQIRLRA